MKPIPGMRYVRPDGSGARVVLVEDGAVHLDDGWIRAASTMVPFHGYALDWSDGATLGAVEHDVLGPAGWCVERAHGMWRMSHPRKAAHRWWGSLAEALRDALEVLGG